MRIVITGAAGDIGQIAADALAESHDLVLIDRRPIPGRKTVRANLSVHRLSDPLRPRAWLQRWPRSFAGADVVLHLAAERNPGASWWRVLRHNVKATWNVFEVAAEYGVSKVVFASSNWAVNGYRLELGSAAFDPGGPKIGSDCPPHPRTPYGISKGLGEMAGRVLVDEERIHSFVAVRIGHCPPDGRALVSSAHCRNHWIGIRDMQSLIRRCVELDLAGFHVVHAVSAQPESPFDLTYTKKLLAWKPEEWAEPLQEESVE